MDTKTGLSSPWGICYSEIEALFGQDYEIHIERDFTDAQQMPKRKRIVKKGDTH